MVPFYKGLLPETVALVIQCPYCPCLSFPWEQCLHVHMTALPLVIFIPSSTRTFHSLSLLSQALFSLWSRCCLLQDGKNAICSLWDGCWSCCDFSAPCFFIPERWGTLLARLFLAALLNTQGILFLLNSRSWTHDYSSRWSTASKIRFKGDRILHSVILVYSY